MLRRLEAGLAARSATNQLATYRPYPKQQAFHAAGASHRERLFMAGNQLGKTVMGAIKRSWDRDHATSAVTVGGTANAIALSYAVGPAGYVQGEKFAFKATAANTGATTVNVQSLGAKSLFKKTGGGAAALTGGEIQAGDIVEIEFDGTQFQLAGMPANIAVDPTSLTPTGAVMPFAGAAAPSGWLLCAGQAVNRTTYAALFAVIGTTFGAGDGTTTFTLPDLRGRAVFGVDNMGGVAANRLGSGATGGITGTASLGATGGEQKHILTIAEMPAHTHTYNDVFAPGVNQLGSAGNVGTGNTGSTGGGSAHNVTPPAIVLNHIIKI
jgi:microcystin-dependent protein